MRINKQFVDKYVMNICDFEWFDEDNANVYVMAYDSLYEKFFNDTYSKHEAFSGDGVWFNCYFDYNIKTRKLTMTISQNMPDKVIDKEYELTGSGKDYIVKTIQNMSKDE